MDYRLDYFVEYNWTVSRAQCGKYLEKLSTRNAEFEAIENGDSFNMVGEEVNKFWTPDTFSPDTKKIELTTLPGRNIILALDVLEDGCAFRQQIRLAAIVGCQMDFRNYPFDVQRCPFRLRSHFYPSNMVHYRWSEIGVRIGGAKDMRLNHYEVNLDWDEYDGVTVNYGELNRPS